MTAWPLRVRKNPEDVPPSPVKADAVLNALAAAGILSDRDHIHRVVLDLRVGHVAQLYVERYGDDRLLDLVRTVDGIEVRGVPR